jgi:hypothetical protein
VNRLLGDNKASIEDFKKANDLLKGIYAFKIAQANANAESGKHLEAINLINQAIDLNSRNYLA